jgi:type I restriction enzyme, R subunit
MSSGDRKQRIVADIIHDFGVLPRLNNDRGTAILVAASIYDACHYFRLFQNTAFGQYCHLITSYEPNHNAISREPANSDERYKFDTYTQHVLKNNQTTKQYEDATKRRFIEEPANCKLLIVVSKLLTGFDAPSCTYIYLDNEMRDHTLFQAICRTNRLDGDDKDYGYIVDYKALLEQVQNSIAVYNSDELDIDESSGDSNIVLKDYLEEGKAKLEDAREALYYLCEPVAQPREVEQYLHYFCGDADDFTALSTTEPLRISFYKSVVTVLRAYAAIVRKLEAAGYSNAEIAALEQEMQFYTDLRLAIKQHSGEELDIKPYEADMRHLINTYIQADPSQALGNLNALTLTEAIIETGIHNAIAQKLNQKGNLSQKAIADGIINNVRKTIIRDQLTDPRFYAEMSMLLDDLIQQKRTGTQSYEQFLRDAEALINRLGRQQPIADIPAILHGKLEAIVLFNNLASIPATAFQCPEEPDEKAAIALELDQTMRDRAPANWKGDDIREKQVLNAIFPIMLRDHTATQAIFEIIKNQGGY